MDISDPLEAEDRPGRKSRRTLQSTPGGQPYQRALDDDQPGVPPTDDFEGPWRKGVLSGTAESKTQFLSDLLDPLASLTQRLPQRL